MSAATGDRFKVLGLDPSATPELPVKVEFGPR
jgi:hypothetical protein